MHKKNGANLNKFVNSAKQEFEKKLVKPLTSCKSEICNTNTKNGTYAFKIRYFDRDRTVVFPKNEVIALASDIGIDLEHDKSTYVWFLHQALVSDLPYGWQKERDPNGKTTYYNNLTNETSKSHPNAHKFRIAFNDLLKTEVIKRTVAEEIEGFTTNAEKQYFKELVQTMNKEELAKVLKKVKCNIGNDESKAAEELTRQLIKSNIPVK